MSRLASLFCSIYKLGQPNIEQSRTMELEYFIQLLDMAGWESLLPSHIGTGLDRDRDITG